MAFKKRNIEVTFKLGQGKFGESGFDTVTLSGLRCIVDIAQAGGLFKGALNLRIYGMSMSDMNQLVRVGRISEVRANRVIIRAGDGDLLSEVYDGTIFMCWVDYSAMPDVCLNVEAAAGWFESNKPVPPISIKGPADAATLFAGIAKSMGAAFRNHGVDKKIASPYLWGSAWDQIIALHQALNINFSFELGVLHIWEKGKHRLEDLTKISEQTGMVGFPTVTSNGVDVVTEFRPSIVIGGLVNLETTLLPANGAWIVDQVAFNLASETPNGPWFARMTCSRPDQPNLSHS